MREERGIDKRAVAAAAVFHALVAALLLVEWPQWESPVEPPKPIEVALVVEPPPKPDPPPPPPVPAAKPPLPAYRQSGPDQETRGGGEPRPLLEPPAAPEPKATEAVPEPAAAPEAVAPPIETPPAPPTPAPAEPPPPVEAADLKTPPEPRDVPPMPQSKPAPPERIAAAPAAPLAAKEVAPRPIPSPGAPGPPSMGDAYLNAVRDQVMRNRVYPAAARPLQLRGRASYAVVVDRKGRVLAVRLTRSSGSTLLDTSGEATIRKSAPWPPLPSDIPGEAVTVELDLPIDPG